MCYCERQVTLCESALLCALMAPIFVGVVWARLTSSGSRGLLELQIIL